MSTFSRASCSAISTFSARVSAMPGPARRRAGSCRRSVRCLPFAYVAFRHSGTTFVSHSNQGIIWRSSRPTSSSWDVRAWSRSRRNSGEPGVGLRDPLLGERAVLDLVEDPPHLGAGLGRRRPAVRACSRRTRPCRRSSSASTTGRPRTSGPRSASARAGTRSTRSPAGTRPRRASRTRPGPAPRAAAEHRLLAEQVGLGLFLERGLEHAGARAADAGRVGERALMRLPGRVLVHGDQTRASRCPARTSGGPGGRVPSGRSS